MNVSFPRPTGHRFCLIVFEYVHGILLFICNFSKSFVTMFGFTLRVIFTWCLKVSIAWVYLGTTCHEEVGGSQVVLVIRVGGGSIFFSVEDGLATPESDSSLDSTTSSEADSSSESISLPTKARALPDELFLCDEDLEEDLEEDFEDFFFLLSSESYSLLFFFFFSLSHCGHSEM